VQPSKLTHQNPTRRGFEHYVTAKPSKDAAPARSRVDMQFADSWAGTVPPSGEGLLFPSLCPPSQRSSRKPWDKVQHPKPARATGRPRRQPEGTSQKARRPMTWSIAPTSARLEAVLKMSRAPTEQGARRRQNRRERF
jgi:hypothetical protein